MYGKKGVIIGYLPRWVVGLRVGKDRAWCHGKECLAANREDCLARRIDE